MDGIIQLHFPPLWLGMRQIDSCLKWMFGVLIHSWSSILGCGINFSLFFKGGAWSFPVCVDFWQEPEWVGSWRGILLDEQDGNPGGCTLVVCGWASWQLGPCSHSLNHWREGWWIRLVSRNVSLVCIETDPFVCVSEKVIDSLVPRTPSEMPNFLHRMYSLCRKSSQCVMIFLIHKHMCFASCTSVVKLTANRCFSAWLHMAIDHHTWQTTWGSPSNLSFLNWPLASMRRKEVLDS